MSTPIIKQNYLNVSEFASDCGNNMKERSEDFESQSKRALKYLNNLEDLVSYNNQ
jgi:hypothetical protein